MDRVCLHLEEGKSLLDGLLEAGYDLAHDCGGTLACASCRVLVREGAERLGAPTEDELDMLERAGAAETAARLACQVRGLASEIAVDIPGRETPPSATGTRLFVSPRAARHLAAQLARHLDAVAVRLAVQAAGCSGLRYRVDPAHAIGAGDTVFDQIGVRIVVDEASLPYVQGTVIDLDESALARRLRYDNPNARTGCGCGKSFGV